jgi:hypothetical protein
METLKLTFGQLESALAVMHFIADAQRTKFQARLKNLHRLGFPKQLESSKGKTTLYDPGLVFEMALAIELTELGMPPERVVATLANDDLAVGLAMKESAAGWLDLYGFRAERWVFLTLDPTALWPLTTWSQSPDSVDAARVTLFCMNSHHVAQNFERLTSMSARLSLVDVSALLNRLRHAQGLADDEFKAFLEALTRRGRELADLESADGATKATRAVARHLIVLGLDDIPGDVDHFAEQLSKHLFLPVDIVRNGIELWREKEADYGRD